MPFLDPRGNLGAVQHMVQHERRKSSDVLDAFNAAVRYCQSLGLGTRIEKGRFGAYRTNLTFLVDALDKYGSKNLPADVRQRVEGDQCRTALVEATEFGDLLPFLQTCSQKQVTFKLKRVLAGPELARQEDLDQAPGSNDARNTQFELCVGAMLATAELAPALENADDDPDVQCLVAGIPVHFECKRPFSRSSLGSNVEKAVKKLRETARGKRTLRIATISLSHLLNPSDAVVRARNFPSGQEHLRFALRRAVNDMRDAWAPPLLAFGVEGALFHGAGTFENQADGILEYGKEWYGETVTSLEPPYQEALDTLIRLTEAVY